MYQNGGRSGNSAIRKAESIIFTVVRTANRKCVFQEEEDGSVSTARNAGLILSRKVKKDCMTRPAVWKLVFFCFIGKTASGALLN